jgi:hypothetical protein
VAVAVAKEYRMTQYHASDREVLTWVEEALNEDGYAESVDVAARVWPRVIARNDEDSKMATHAAGTRLSYMARELGVVEKVVVGGKIKWSITDVGEQMLRGKLRAAVAHGIEDMDTAQSVLAMQALAQRAHSRDMAGTLITRAFRFAAQRR